MTLHQQEYEQAEAVYGRYLRYYNGLPEYLHEMSAEEIIERANRNGVNSSVYQKIAVVNYLKWLYENYRSEVDTDALRELYFKLQMMLNEDKGTYIGFYDLTDLKQSIEKKLQELECTNQTDFNGLKAFFFLEWYGISPESAVSIKLTDVAEDGSKVYVPSENRTVDIPDMGVADYLSEYKHAKGFKKYENKEEIPYTQDTFYRNTSDSPIILKTIYNIKCRFQLGEKDKRFEKRRLYRSGRYYALLQEEQKYDRELTSTNEKSQDVIDKVFNFSKHVDVQRYILILREYKLYKIGYINRE